MHGSREETLTFQLFDSAGIGLIGLEESGRISQVNGSLLRYLDLDREGLLGREITLLREVIPSPDFWGALQGRRPFYCLLPGSNHLLLTLCRDYPLHGREGTGRVVLLRPYSLEREFVRMRSRLSRNTVLEISSHLSSVAIAGEIILQPELQEEEATRKRFLSTFLTDITDLSDLFNELQEIAEPVPFPTRVRFAPLDWRGLVTDLLSKMRGLANERNIALSGELSPPLSSPRGDYHWLYLALFTLLNHALGEASPLSTVQVACSAAEGGLKTVVEYTVTDPETGPEWPPPSLFYLPEEDPRIEGMSVTDLSISRNIFLLHRGEVRLEEKGEVVRLHIQLPL